MQGAVRGETLKSIERVAAGKRWRGLLPVGAVARDPRCAPWRARKFAARLQAATAGTSPIWLHIWENVGHGWATDREVAINENAEWIGFILRELGVDGLAGR